MRALLLVAALAGTYADIHSDLATLLKSFPGEYDNYAEWEADIENNATDKHEHVHSIFFGPVDLPAFGSNIYYVQQYSNGVPSEIYRQRLYSWLANETSGSIVLSFFDFINGTRYVDAQKDPSKLKGLTRAETTQVTPKCNVQIKRDADGIFRGGTTKACVVKDHTTGSDIEIKDNNEFGANYVSIHERGFDAKTGAKIFGSDTPDVLNRTRAARRFTGYVAVGYDYSTNISIWDAGQLVPVVTAKGPTNFTVELAYCTYPNGDNVLKLALHEKGYTHDGKIVPPAYAYTQPDANQIGINLRYAGAGFTLAPE